MSASPPECRDPPVCRSCGYLVAECRCSGKAYDDRDREPPRGGWALLLLLIIGFWAGSYMVYRWLRSFF